MNKFKSFIEKLKKNIFIYIVVWLLLAILLVAPITYTFTDGAIRGLTWFESLSQNLFHNILSLKVTEVFYEAYKNDFLYGLKLFSIAYVAIVFYTIYKTLPKGGYDKIEHGSSDWCKNGEEYKVLSKKEGIILAKDYYLPTDKVGNVNVLIVGRFWFW